MDGGPELHALILDSPKERARLRQEMQARNALGRTDEGWLTNLRKPENMGYDGKRRCAQELAPRMKILSLYAAVTDPDPRQDPNEGL